MKTNLICSFSLMILAFFATACVETDAPQVESTATFALSGPTLQPSPTFEILNSEELYGNDSNNEGQNNEYSASVPNNGVILPVDSQVESDGTTLVSMTMMDGKLLQGSLLTASELERNPAIIIISTEPAAWMNFAENLHREGMNVLIVKGRPEPQAADIPIILRTVAELPTVQPSLIGIISETQQADSALTACAEEGLCKALVMLSPLDGEDSVRVQFYNPRPVFIASSEQDVDSYPVSVGIAQKAANGVLRSYPQGQGSGLLALNPELETEIINWIVEVIRSMSN
ncbi:hypothetical protein MASR2M15_19280 [Anaerolineales bacterium]